MFRAAKEIHFSSVLISESPLPIAPISAGSIPISEREPLGSVLLLPDSERTHMGQDSTHCPDRVSTR
jgi:hypothetical protein